jgi:archaetidylinositol phosphate synthase
MSDKQSHKRINDILLGPLERPALQWLAAHMPSWMTPDLLTFIGIFGAVIIFAGYILSNVHPAFLWVATIGFVVNWFGDSLDGTLARYRKIERPKYGYFVDHTVDSFSQLLIFSGLGLSPFISLELALLALVGYLLMSILVYVDTYVTGVFKISYGKLGPTEMRAIAIILNFAFLYLPVPTLDLSFGQVSIYDLLTLSIALLLILIFIFSTIRRAGELAKLERPSAKARV